MKRECKLWRHLYDGFHTWIFVSNNDYRIVRTDTRPRYYRVEYKRRCISEHNDFMRAIKSAECKYSEQGWKQ